MTQMNVSMKQKQVHRHREQCCGYQGAGGLGGMDWEVGRHGLGGWDQQMQIIICRMNKQQDPTVQHKELYLISCDKL